MPVVSIILPTFNRAHTLHRAIQSVFDQTFKDFEIIVIDDASRDNTVDIVKNFDDERLVYKKLEKNIGAAAARNIGINIAKGRYIGFQDSDDEWFPEKLIRQVSFFEKAGSHIGVVYTSIWRVQQDGKKYHVPEERNKGYKKGEDIQGELLSENLVALPAALVRKQCFEEAGMFDESLPCWQDWELWIRISEKFDFHYIDEPLLNAYYSIDSISVNYKKVITAWDLMSCRHHEKFINHKKKLAQKKLYIANLNAVVGEMYHCRKNLLQAFVANPFNLRSVIFIFLSLFGNRVYKMVVSRLYNL